MITSLSLLLLIGITLTVLAIRNAKNTRLFSFPFLFAAVTTAFVIVEFSDFILNSDNLFRTYFEAGVIDVALFMIATCSAGALIGYKLARGRRYSRRSLRQRFRISKTAIVYMHVASLVLGAVSFAAFGALANLAGGLQEYILYSGSYDLEWTGLPVYLIFLVRLGYVSIVIQLWLWSYTKKNSHLIFAIIFSIIPVINIIFLFRRSEVIKLGVFYGYFLTNYHKVRIGRLTTLMSIGAMYLVFKIFPLLRSEVGNDRAAGSILADALSARETYDASEIGSGLLRIYTSLEAGIYEYGAIFPNAVIKQFLPSGLVGSETKEALYLPTVEYADTYFATFRFYVSPMGFAQAFQQFWLFGAILFVLVGAIMARLERGAQSSMRYEVFLVLMIPAAVSTVSADLAYFIPQLITYLAMVLLCVPGVHRTALISASHNNLNHPRKSVRPVR